MTAPLAERLRAAGLRRTPARLTVQAVIEELGRPVSHAELLEEPRIAGMDQITLYRTLSTLEQAGLVHRVFGIDGVWRTCAQPTDRDGCPGNHAHFLCTGCGLMVCLLDQVMPRVEVPPEASVQGRHFLVYGRCGACARQEAG